MKSWKKVLAVVLSAVILVGLLPGMTRGVRAEDGYTIDPTEKSWTVNTGYGEQDSATVRITNNSSEALTVKVETPWTGTDNNKYSVTDDKVSGQMDGISVAAGSSADLFTITPKTGLAAGWYPASIKLAVTIGETTNSETLTFTTTVSDAHEEKGEVNYGAKWTSASEIGLTVTATKDGTAKYVVQDAGAAAPDKKSFQSSGTSIVVSGGSGSATVSASSAKDIYFVYSDGTTADYGLTKLSLPAPTTISGSEGSEVGSVSFKAEREGSANLSLSVTPTVDGTLYYIVKDADEGAPSDEEFQNAASLSETKGVTKTSSISLGANPTNAKKVYVRYYADPQQVGTTGVLEIPAYQDSSFAAQIEPSELNLGTVLEGYTATDHAATATVKNTGAGTVTFAVDRMHETYANFTQYFRVDYTGAQNIASGASGSVTVTPVEGLTAGEYTGVFYLVDKIDDTHTLTLGPVTVKMTVAAKGDGTVEGVRQPSGEYTPSSEVISDGIGSPKIDGKIAYCANYHYTLSTQSNTVMNKLYEGKFGVIEDVTNKELDSYTGLDPSAKPVVYPPNNYNYTPVKVGSDSSTVRDNVARVLYYGYPNDAAKLGPTSSNKVQNYNFFAVIKARRELVYMVATQCAIWHYTDGIDFTGIHSGLSSDPRIQHIRMVYSGIDAFTWGWSDVENLYEILINSDYIYQPNRVKLDPSTLTLD